MDLGGGLGAHERRLALGLHAALEEMEEYVYGEKTPVKQQDQGRAVGRADGRAFARPHHGTGGPQGAPLGRCQSRQPNGRRRGRTCARAAAPFSDSTRLALARRAPPADRARRLARRRRSRSTTTAAAPAPSWPSARPGRAQGPRLRPRLRPRPSRALAPLMHRALAVDKRAARPWPPAPPRGT